jgi:transposase
MQSNELFATALGVVKPWYVKTIDFDVDKHVLLVEIDFVKGTRFPVEGVDGLHGVHDTVKKRYRHMNFFQHECYLEVRVPRVKRPDGKGPVQVEPDWVGKLSGFTLLFEAFILMLCRKMTFQDAARIAGISWHHAHAICSRYVELAVEKLDLSKIDKVAFDETSSRRGHNYVTFAADAEARKVVFVTQGKDAETITEFKQFLMEHKGKPEQIASVSIDMSQAFIKGVSENLPKARITFDKFHVVAHASKAVDETRRSEQKTDPDLKGLRWALLKSKEKLTPTQQADLSVFLATGATKRTAQAWQYREQLREILDRKQINVVATRLKRWCSNVKRSKLDEMKKVANMIIDHFDGVIAWAQTRQTNGFLEAINGLFQAAKRKARGYGNFKTMRIVAYLVAGDLQFSAFNKHA